MKNKRILYVASELCPYLPQTDVSACSLQIPKLMQDQGSEVRIFMPKYGNINERRHQLHEVIRLSGMNLVVNDIDQPLIIKVASIPKERLQVYFIDNDEYFKNRKMYADENQSLYPDNDERAIFFAKGVLETVKKLNWSPDIIHVHGWMSYVLPLYVKTLYRDDPAYSDTRIVTSVYGDCFEGILSSSLAEKLRFDSISEDLLEEPTYENLTKTCLKYSDGAILVGEDIPESIVGFAESCNLAILRQPSSQACESDFYSGVYQQVLSLETSRS